MWALAEDARSYKNKMSAFLLVSATPTTPTIAPTEGTIQAKGEVRTGHGMNARPDKITKAVPTDSKRSDLATMNTATKAKSGNTTRNAGLSIRTATKRTIKLTTMTMSRTLIRSLALDREMLESWMMSEIELGTKQEASPGYGFIRWQTRARLSYPPEMGVMVEASAIRPTAPTSPHGPRLPRSCALRS